MPYKDIKKKIQHCNSVNSNEASKCNLKYIYMEAFYSPDYQIWNIFNTQCTYANRQITTVDMLLIRIKSRKAFEKGKFEI